ncbi:MAG: hypothetical protein HOH13_08625 [Crocinitomicaceae bacterium]|nr:hypothetical protein [Crocinitomicaceae bacterium]
MSISIEFESMKNRSWYLVLSILCVSISFNSCTIKKRLYQPGYHVQWHKTVKESNSNAIENVEKSSELHSEAEATVVKQSIKAEQTFQPEIAAADEPIYASTEMNQFSTSNSKLPIRNRVFSLKTKKRTTAPINAKMRETFPTSIEEDNVKRKVKGLLIAAIFSAIIAFICIAIGSQSGWLWIASGLAITGFLFGLLAVILLIVWGIFRSTTTAPINAKMQETSPTSIEEDKVKSNEKRLLKPALFFGIMACILIAFFAYFS